MRPFRRLRRRVVRRVIPGRKPRLRPSLPRLKPWWIP